MKPSSSCAAAGHYTPPKNRKPRAAGLTAYDETEGSEICHFRLEAVYFPNRHPGKYLAQTVDYSV
jgi:hypothetical protein